MIPIIAITGYSDAGKTTVIEKVVPELRKKGFRVGTVKHADHELNFDKRGKDSWRHFDAGADAVLVSSPNKLMIVRRQTTVPDEAALLAFFEKHLADMDLVLAEGFKNSNLPKIEVFRFKVNDTPACLDDSALVAMVTDADLNVSVPMFGLEDSEPLADFIVERFLLFKSSKASFY
jgi:molybdopterin-guanine dinucleotide biosynthesis protein B